jgi:tetratricopeptide (TPR) repeat protein
MRKKNTHLNFHLVLIGALFICLIFFALSSNVEAQMKSTPLIVRADSLFDSEQLDKALEAYQQAADSASATGDNTTLTEAYAQIARIYLKKNDKEEGRLWLKKTSVIVDPHDPLSWSRYLGVRGRFEWQDQELKKATATFKEMYQYCSMNGLHERAIDAAHMVAVTGGPDEQVEWGLKGIKEAEAGNITGWLGPLWNNLGATYEDQGKYKESLDAYLKAREYHYKSGSPHSKLIADWAVGHAYRLNNQPDSAAKWITSEMVANFDSLGDIEFQGWTYKELGEIALQRSRPDSALAYLTQAEEKLRAADMPNWDADGYKKLQEQIEKLGK